MNKEDEHTPLPLVDEQWAFAGPVRAGLAQALARACNRRDITHVELHNLSWDERLEMIWGELGGLETVQHLVTEAADDMLRGETRFSPPVVTLNTWARDKKIAPRKALSWVERGYLPGAYQAGESWLIPTNTAVPVVPRGIAAKRVKEAKTS